MIKQCEHDANGNEVSDNEATDVSGNEANNVSGTAPVVLPTSPLDLSFLGDAVFELLVRDNLLRSGTPSRELFNRAKGFVSAKAQADMYHKIFPHLSQEEQAIMKRGRNLHTVSRSKSANVTAYRHATGLETLFGFLHLHGETNRVTEIFAMCISNKLQGDTQNEGETQNGL